MTITHLPEPTSWTTAPSNANGNVSTTLYIMSERSDLRIPRPIAYKRTFLRTKTLARSELILHHSKDESEIFHPQLDRTFHKRARLSSYRRMSN